MAHGGVQRLEERTSLGIVELGAVAGAATGRLVMVLRRILDTEEVVKQRPDVSFAVSRLSLPDV
jgi:hypothetical protein